MGGRGSASSGARATGGGISQSELDLVAGSPQYGSFITGTNDSSVYSYGAAQGLSRPEIDLVHSYTNDLFQNLNDDIRAGKKGVTDFVTNKLNQTLDKLPNTKGDVFRGISVNDPSGFANSLKNAGSFKFDSFTSTTTSKSKAKEFTTKNKSVIFEIKSKTGKNVAKLSSQKDEDEVLFKAGTRFKYRGHRTENGITYITLGE